jgi:hypothetical protein
MTTRALVLSPELWRELEREERRPARRARQLALALLRAGGRLPRLALRAVRLLFIPEW